MVSNAPATDQETIARLKQYGRAIHGIAAALESRLGKEVLYQVELIETVRLAHRALEIGRPGGARKILRTALDAAPKEVAELPLIDALPPIFEEGSND